MCDIVEQRGCPYHQVACPAEGMPPFNHGSAQNSASTPTLDIAVDGSTLSVPISTSSPNLMKSASSPVILSTDHHRDRKDDSPRANCSTDGITMATTTQQPNLVIQHLLAAHDAHLARTMSSSNGGEEVEEEDDEEMLQKFRQNEISHSRLSLIEFLNDDAAATTTNFDASADERKKEVKEEKKRRSSVFAKFGSYRQKRVVKDNKLLKNTHQFVSVSFSNSTTCDMCNKPMANKLGLQCENCMMNVHDSSCKDQMATCTRHVRRLHAQSSVKERSRRISSSLPGATGGTHLRASQSFMERRTVSVPSKTSLQTSLSSGVLPRVASGTIASPPVCGSSGHFQWRRVATKLGLDKVIDEDESQEKKKDEDTTNQLLPTESSNMTDGMSVSMESLDEGAVCVFPGSGETTELEDDPDLALLAEEAEAWSVTVDKKTLRKMSAKDIKRQDHIWEFVQTEKSHCRTLKIMQRILAHGMLNEAGLTKDMVDRIFPKLDTLLDIHLTFLRRLTERQRLHSDKSIDEIGDIFVQQLKGEMGERMKTAYGEFCSRHNESVQLYKDILKSDRKFQNFIKKCSRNSLCKRKGVPECILLVTQRMTKYPLLIEPIIKTTKDTRMDIKLLEQALLLARDILNSVDRQVDAREKEHELIEIYNKLDARSSALYKSKKFKKSDLLSNNRKLVHQGYIKWMTARGKPFEVLAVILSDVIFFLSENNQKYTFFSQDNKSSVISMSKLIVREKGDTRDSKGLYLICQSKTEPEMYELVCRSTEDRKSWIATIRAAIASCPEEDEGMPSEGEEERKLQEARAVKLRQLTDDLHQKDNFIKQCCDEKMKVILEMLDIYGHDGASNSLKSVYRDEEGQELMEPEELIHAALYEASHLTHTIQSNSVNLARSVSNASECERPCMTSPVAPLPKRAETFSGFEGREKEKCVLKKRYPASFREVDSRSNSMQSLLLQLDCEPGAKQQELLAPKVSRMRRGSVGVVSIQESTKPNKEKMSRRMSTSFLHNLLLRQHNDTRDESLDSRLSLDRSSDRGSSSELSTTSSSFSSVGTSQLREQLASVAQLVQYMQALVCIITQQSTEVESFRSQLAEANTLVSYLTAETDHLSHDRKTSYQHDKQLEELRNLQEVLSQERSRLESAREKQQVELEQQAEELERTQAELQEQKAEVQAQRDELQHQREVLQRQIDLFEQQKSQWLRSVASGSPRGVDSREGSPSTRGGLQTSGTVTTSIGQSPTGQLTVEMPLHKRSSSDELSRASPERRPLTNAAKHTSHNAPGSTEMTRRESTREIPLPANLLSATNEQKLSVQQQLSLRLSDGATSGTASAAVGASAKQAGTSGMQQMLPFKLLSGMNTQVAPPPSGSAMTNNTNASPMQAGRSILRTNSSGKLQSCTVPQSPVATATGRGAKTRSHSTISLLHSTSHTSTPVAQPTTVNMLPMKLAQKQRPKSASASMQSVKHAGLSIGGGTSVVSLPKSSGKKEPEIIYF